VGTGRRSGGDRNAGADLRPALDVRIQRPAAGVAPFELARIMGTSIAMIERSYGALIGGAREGIAARLD
jgi:hypothetical protein